MQTERIVLALALAALATPALAEKCSVCDFSDEPIVVKPTEQKNPSAPSVSELVVTKLSDAANTELMLSTARGRHIGGGFGNDMLISGFGNDTMKSQGGLSALGGTPAPRTVLTGAAGGQPAASISLSFTKIEYKYTPYDAKGPAAGAMAVRR